MTIYCIDDGGDGSQTNTTQSASTLDWSKADTSFSDLLAYDASALTTNGNIIYVGDDHNDPNVSANQTYTGPSTGGAVFIISVDRTQSTPTYKRGTGAQMSSLGGNYTLTVIGAFAMDGIRIASGGTGTLSIQLDQDYARFGHRLHELTLVPGAGGTCGLGGNSGDVSFTNLVIDLTADGTTGRSASVISAITGNVTIRGITFVNPGYRNGYIFSTSTSNGFVNISGADFSGFTNATECEIVGNIAGSGLTILQNCMTKASPVLLATITGGRRGPLCLYNVGEADDPVKLLHATRMGICQSFNGIYRTGGATAEGDTCSWLITTDSSTNENIPFYTPWIYGAINNTGLATFNLYITNDTADFTDAECWLEVEYLSIADEAIWSLATDHRSTITVTAVNQTDDTSSTWNGSGPSFTYKQKLSVTATIGETGQFRARVAVGKASITGSSYFYIDPDITIT